MPPLPPTIQTHRLTLTHLTNTTPGHFHVDLFHQNWCDPITTAGSRHGATHSLEESRDWMIECLTKHEMLYYTVFAKQFKTSSEEVHIGSVHLRRQRSGPSVPPPALAGVNEGEMEVNLVVIGYVYKKEYWGLGYATEAGRALLDAYAASVVEEKALGRKMFYVEAGTGSENLASVRVLEKLGFRLVGGMEGNSDGKQGRAGMVYLGMYI